LSWHLTRRERDKIRDEWNRLMSQPCPWGTVKSFLRSGDPGTIACDAPRCLPAN
jgi:hypothetical protein